MNSTKDDAMNTDNADGLAEQIRQWHDDFIEWFRDMGMCMSDRSGRLFDRIDAIERAALAASPDAQQEWKVGNTVTIRPTRMEVFGSSPSEQELPPGVKPSKHAEYDRGFSDGWNRCEERLAKRTTGSGGKT